MSVFRHSSERDRIVMQGNRCVVWGVILGVAGLMMAAGDSAGIGPLLVLIGGVVFVGGLYLGLISRL